MPSVSTDFCHPIEKVEGAHADNIWAVTWSQGNIVTGSLDGTIKLWSNASNEGLALKFVSPVQKTGCASVAAVKDGSLAIACYQDSIIRFYDLHNQSHVATIDAGLFEAYSISLSPADDVLVGGTSSGSINLWSMQEGHELVSTLKAGSKQILSTAFSIEGKLASSGIDGYVSIYDMSTQSAVHKLDAHAMPVRSVAFSPEGDLLYTASDDRHVSVYDMKAGSLINSFSHSGMALSVDASPDHRHFCVGCGDHSVAVWDLGMQRRVDTKRAHTDQVWGVRYDGSDASGRRFVSVSDDGAIQVYG